MTYTNCPKNPNALGGRTSKLLSAFKMTDCNYSQHHSQGSADISSF